MKFDIKLGTAADQTTACAIVPVYASGVPGDAARSLDTATDGLIRDALDSRDIKGEVGETLLLAPGAGAPCRRILLVGLGARDKVDRKAFRRAARAAFGHLARTRHASAISYLGLEPVGDADAGRKARIQVEAWHDVTYRFTAMKSEPGDGGRAQKSIALAADARQARAVRRGIAEGEAIGRAVALVRDLGNLPPNVCTPSYLVERARGLARHERRIKVKAFGEADLRRLRMGAFLAVTQGSEEPPRFIVLEYKGGKPGDRPYVFVGKGITFDTGGISIKPAAAMDEMKYDMCGAATVLGVLQAAAELRLPLNVVGIVPTCENMPSGRATRPGDIVRTMQGTTVEILNTDAEGRLILCDALTYAQRYKPAALVDIATLTGACLVALGRVRSGLFSNSDALADALLAAGQAADDRAWRLPLDPEYGDLLKSNFADIANVGGRDGGAITAALFLARFTAGQTWAHLDIAGTAWVQGGAKGGTGRPVPLLLEYLLSR
jgi:leucyl aminopeptidase